MRISFLVYGVLYVVVEIVGHQLESIGWPQLTPLDVATAVANACLTVAVGIAVLVGMDVGGRRWRRALQDRREQRLRSPGGHGDRPGLVPRLRGEPRALLAPRQHRAVPAAAADVRADQDGDADGHGQARVGHRGGDVQRG